MCRPNCVVDVGDERQPVDVSRSVLVNRHLAGACRADVADDPLHQPFERHEAGRSSVLVDHDAFAHAALAHRRQQIVGRHRLRHRQRVARDLAGADVPAPGGKRLEDVDRVQDADHVVEIVTIDGKDGISAARDDLEQRLARRVGRNGDQLGARNHHLPGRQVGEVEDPVEHLLFALLEDARFLARGHQHLQLFFGVHERVSAGSAHAEQVDDRRGPCRSAGG